MSMARWSLLLLVPAMLPGTRGAAQAAPGDSARADRFSVVRVVGSGDRAPVGGALIRRGSRTLVRTSIDGFARVPRAPAADAASGRDSVTVQALGFQVAVLALDADSIVVRLQHLPTMLPRLITTVGQRVIRADEETRRITVLDRRDLDAAAAVSANQLLRQLPGVQEIASPPARTSLSIRGFNDARVLVLVDGEPVPGTLMDSRDIGRLSTLAAERIEVTKGPGAVEYGSDAIGGVINLVQAAPTSSWNVDMTARAGELGRREGTVGASNSIGPFGFRVNGGWRQVDQVTGIDATGSTLSRTWDARGDLRYQLHPRVALRLDVQSTMERQRWPVDGLFNGFIDNVATQGFVETTVRAAGGQWRLRGFSQRFAYQYRQATGLAPIAGSGDSLEQREAMDRVLLAYSTTKGRHTVDVGTQWSDRHLVAPARITGDQVSDRVFETWVRDAFALGRVRVTAGVRQTEGSLWGSATNPSLGVSGPLGGGIQWRANRARGFRAPGFKDIRYTFTNAAGGYVIEGNPQLTPESSWSTSMGVTWRPREAVNVDVEWYRTDVRDMIDTRFQGVNAAGLQRFTNVNLARARSEGIEVNLDGQWQGATWSLGYDHLRARDLEYEVPLSRRARHTLRARAARRFAVASGLTVDATVRHVSAAPLVSAGSVDGAERPTITAQQGAMTTVDLQFRQQLRSGLELASGVNNLLGQRPALWTPAFDRQLFASLRWVWAPVRGH